MSDRWTRLQELVEAASEMDPDERTAFLEPEAGHDRALRDEAAELLVAGLGNEGFLDPLVGDAPLKVGSTLGPFRIVRPLARGGMGMVFEATQESPSRRVALKVMRSDLMTPASRSRFRYEIEALGALVDFALGVGNLGDGHLHAEPTLTLTPRRAPREQRPRDDDDQQTEAKPLHANLPSKSRLRAHRATRRSWRHPGPPAPSRCAPPCPTSE